MKLKFVLLLLLFLSAPAYAQLTINEIMYSPDESFGGTYNEWVELYNSGESGVNITDWIFAENSKNHTLSGTINAKNYIIFARKPDTFKSYYNTTATVYETRFMLNDNGEELILKNKEGEIIDSINYLPLSGANGKGKTLEKNNSGWFESDFSGGTPGIQNSIVSFENVSNQNKEGPIIEKTPQIEQLNESCSQQKVSDRPLDIEIVRAPDSLKFGDLESIHIRFFSGNKNFSKARFVAYVYRPNWISKDILLEDITLKNAPYNSRAAIEIENIQKNSAENMILPIFIKCNQNGQYANGTYTLRIRGYSFKDAGWVEIIETDYEIYVRGENDVCEKRNCEKETVYINKTITENCTQKNANQKENEFLINITAPEVIYLDENFTTHIFIKNMGELHHDFEIYSYVYEHSKIMSMGFDGNKWANSREANSKKISLDSNGSSAFELLNMPRKDITPEKYTYRVRVNSMDSGETVYEEVFLLTVKARDIENSTKTGETITASPSNRLSGEIIAKNANISKLSLWDRIIYRIKRWIEK